MLATSRRDAYGLTRARAGGIPTWYHALAPYKAALPSVSEARAAYDADLAAHILSRAPPAHRRAEATPALGAGAERGLATDAEARDHTQDSHHAVPVPDAVVCLGFMHILSPAFLAPLAAPRPRPVRVLNLHPALPGAFSGADAMRRAWDAARRGDVAASGVMLHDVVEEVDMGAPVLVRDVELRVGDGWDAFQQRMRDAEHAVVVEGTGIALKQMEEGGGEELGGEAEGAV